jgi:hypothetical protein
VVAGRIDVQFGRDTGTLQGQVHDRAVFRVGPAGARLSTETWANTIAGVLAGMWRPGQISSLSLSFK